MYNVIIITKRKDIEEDYVQRGRRRLPTLIDCLRNGSETTLVEYILLYL